MIQKIKKLKSGFVILFAVTLSALLLSIAIGVTNIAFKELRFGTNARDTNDAFFAADTGIERALFDDKTGGASSGPFDIGNLGSVSKSCVKVTVEKVSGQIPFETTIISKGYNTGSGGGNSCNPPTNAVERQLEVRY